MLVYINSHQQLRTTTNLSCAGKVDDSMLGRHIQTQTLALNKSLHSRSSFYTREELNMVGMQCAAKHFENVFVSLDVSSRCHIIMSQHFKIFYSLPVVAMSRIWKSLKTDARCCHVTSTRSRSWQQPVSDLWVCHRPDDRLVMTLRQVVTRFAQDWGQTLRPGWAGTVLPQKVPKPCLDPTLLLIKKCTWVYTPAAKFLSKMFPYTFSFLSPPPQ